MRSYLEVNINTLIENYQNIRKYLNKEIIAVVKSNAYGHGIIKITETLVQQGVNSFFVATLDEAYTLRKYFNHINILLLEPAKDFKRLYANRITLCVTSKEYLKEIIDSKLPFRIHLKIETGLNRLGIQNNDLNEIVDSIKRNKLILKGVFTHLSSTNEYKNHYTKFKTALKYFNDFKNIQIHINSSSYIFKDDISTHYRIGLALYGLINIAYLNLKPILTLKSPIIRVISVKENTYVGYHNIGIIKENGYLYTIPLGYADGWIKSRLTLGYTNNIYFKQVGETCMDNLMLFSTKKINYGDEIEIISKNIDILNLSVFYKESIYQICSLLSPRLERRYIYHD